MQLQCNGLSVGLTNAIYGMQLEQAFTSFTNVCACARVCMLRYVETVSMWRGMLPKDFFSFNKRLQAKKEYR